MLRSLHIENIVLARDLVIEFEEGLNLITGETGAGKSLIVNALSLATGARGEAGLLRQGTDRALVEAIFDLSQRPDLVERLRNLGYDVDEHEILLRREIGGDGRTRAFLNASTVTNAVLKKVTESLVELHGQHEPQTLMQPEQHRSILDRFGGHDELLGRVRLAHGRLREIAAKQSEMEERAAHRESRLAQIDFRLAEFDRCAPDPGSEQALHAERERLRHAEEIGEALAAALERLYEGEGAAIDQVHAAARRLRAQASHGEEYAELAERVDDVSAQLSDLAVDLRREFDDVQADPSRLAAVEEQVHEIERLRQRFGGAPLVEIVEQAHAMRREAAELREESESGEALAAEYARQFQVYQSAAEALGDARRKSAEALTRAVAGLLDSLAMPGAKLEVSLEGVAADVAAREASGALGLEQVEFLLQANPGEPARPLRRVASGGEISRVMLALDIALEGGLPKRTLLFDEVDQGLGGDTAERLGEFLDRVAAHHQVICITHLPQVAARGKRHVRVTKKVKSGRTVAVVKTLEQRIDRIEEVARMLGGATISDTAYRHAEAMIEAGRRPETEGRA